MDKSFIFESDHFASTKDKDLCRPFEVRFSLYFDGDCVMYEDVAIWDNELDVEVELESFPSEEQSRIETLIEKECDNGDNLAELEQCHNESMADYYYDMMRDS